MRVRFQADADLDGRILRGLRRTAPEIDIRTAADAALTGLEDPEVLRIASDSGRILVSQDRRTMPAHFARYSAGAQSPGVILLREARICPGAPPKMHANQRFLTVRVAFLFLVSVTGSRIRSNVEVVHDHRLASWAITA